MQSPFTKEVLRFFEELKQNNSKKWFDENRDRYDKHVVDPSKKFVVELGEKLLSLSEGFQAIPKVNKSLFRLNRDVRFSPDKSPYKTNLGMLFWEGPRKRMENSGAYVHVESGNCFIATGLHVFPKDVLEAYRSAVLDPKKAKELTAILDELKKKHQIKGEMYKNVPRGFDKEYEFSELLKYKGLFVMEPFDDSETYSENLFDKVVEQMKHTMKLHGWFLKYV